MSYQLRKKLKICFCVHSHERNHSDEPVFELGRLLGRFLPMEALNGPELGSGLSCKLSQEAENKSLKIEKALQFCQWAVLCK